jgi:hypothetical protein
MEKGRKSFLTVSWDVPGWEWDAVGDLQGLQLSLAIPVQAELCGPCIRAHVGYTTKLYNLLFSVVFFWWDWGLNLGLCTYKAGSLLLELHIRLILL